MIGVHWMFKEHPRLASARLRGRIPFGILERNGLIRSGEDVVIAAKHNWKAEKVRKHFKKMVMDVCDDHFWNQHAPHYKQACELADVVTCNSLAMSDVIKTHTGRDAVVIDDPYEDEELPPSIGEGVLWFGHSLNLPDLDAIRDKIRYPLTVVDSSNYTPQVLDAALKACRCTIIPTGIKQAKSANRAIRSIRYGKYPVCGHLPAHEEIGLGKSDLLRELDFAMNEDTTNDVLSLQRAIRERFCPEKIAKDWWRVIYSITH